MDIQWWFCIKSYIRSMKVQNERELQDFQNSTLLFHNLKNKSNTHTHKHTNIHTHDTCELSLLLKLCSEVGKLRITQMWDGNHGSFYILHQDTFPPSMHNKYILNFISWESNIFLKYTHTHISKQEKVCGMKPHFGSHDKSIFYKIALIGVF